MPFARANPNQYLLTGRRGALENRGSAVQTYLLPGTIFVLVPSTKQEAVFEFTQETRDGIPLRFKGIVIYRITDPIAAARLFDFSAGLGVDQLNLLITHVCLGELRDAVSHMTMVECIEQRKTTLSEVVRNALQATIHGEGDMNDWGITVEVAQLAQVFIVDAELRQQLESEIRNEIKLRSNQSDIRTDEEARLSAMASDDRVAEQQLASQRQAHERGRELFESEMATEASKVNTEAPVRLLKAAREAEVLREELALGELQNQVHAQQVERALLQPREEQEMRSRMLPLEQAPQIVEAASRVLHGTNLSIYGENAQLLGQLNPIFEILARAVQRAVVDAAAPAGTARE